MLVIGGAGLIGSHTVDGLLKEDVAEILICDNYTRAVENLSLEDSRVRLPPWEVYCTEMSSTLR
jgi:UDP-glucose 4-epimerase